MYLEFSLMVLKRVLPLNIELLNFSVFADSAQIPINPPDLNSKAVLGKVKKVSTSEDIRRVNYLIDTQVD